jgi:hypothetical protein
MTASFEVIEASLKPRIGIGCALQLRWIVTSDLRHHQPGSTLTAFNRHSCIAVCNILIYNQNCINMGHLLERTCEGQGRLGYIMEETSGSRSYKMVLHVMHTWRNTPGLHNANGLQ